MQKLVINLLTSYDSICYVIEHSKDLDTIEVHEVVASLKDYEHRHKRHIDNRTEKAFASLSVRPKQAKFTGNQNIKYQKNRKTQGQKWNNKPNFVFFGRYKPTYQARKKAIGTDGAKNLCKFCDKLHFGECWFKGKPKCDNCDKIVHIAKDYNNKKTVYHLKYANQVVDTPTMFYVCNAATVETIQNVRYIYSKCSNHMAYWWILIELLLPK